MKTKLIAGLLLAAQMMPAVFELNKPYLIVNGPWRACEQIDWACQSPQRGYMLMVESSEARATHFLYRVTADIGTDRPVVVTGMFKRNDSGYGFAYAFLQLQGVVKSARVVITAVDWSGDVAVVLRTDEGGL